MHLSVSARFTFKDRPEGYLGPVWEHISWAKDKPLEFDEMVFSIGVTVLEYYLQLQDAETLNAALDRLRDKWSSICVEEEVVEDER